MRKRCSTPGGVVLVVLSLTAGSIGIKDTDALKAETFRSIVPATVAPAAPLIHRDDTMSTRIAHAYGGLPLSFERNVGQADSRVEFLARGKGYTILLDKGGEAVLSLRAIAPARPEAQGQVRFDPTSTARRPAAEAEANRGPSRGTVLKVRFVGADSNASPQGETELPGKVNYLLGSDRSAWRTGVPTFGKVRYRDIYPGIDVVFYGNQRQLEYDFVVKAGADPRAISMEFDGAERLRINQDGELVAQLGESSVIQRKPVIYQEADGIRHEVRGRYVLTSPTRATVAVDSYDSQKTLIIDPVLVYSTYFDGTMVNGSPGNDQGFAIALDGNGSAFITGETDAGDFVTSPGPFDANPNGALDVFVTKLDATGATVIYSTYLGGGAADHGRAIALDAAGNAYVTGYTESSDFPITAGAFDTTFAAYVDAFVTKLDATGATLLYSTFLGGAGSDTAHAIALDGGGSAYVAGHTLSASFPTTTGAFDETIAGCDDAFVTKLSASGSALVYSTFLGGSGCGAGDAASGIAVDAAGSAYVTGSTAAADFPTTAGAFATTLTGLVDVFVAKLDASGASLAYSTYLGGSNTNNFEAGKAIAVDAGGNAYVIGVTASSDFPTTAGAFDTTFGGGVFDAFVTKLDATGATLTYSTYLGGSGSEGSANEYNGNGIVVDAAGNAYVTGGTSSGDFPTTAGAFDTTCGADAFVTKLDPSGTTLVYSTCIGGASIDENGRGIAIDAAGSIYITGPTPSTDFPTTLGAFDATANGGQDAFVTKLNASGSTLVYSTYLGGSLKSHPDAIGQTIAVDGGGNAYVAGLTNSVNLPVTAGTFDGSANGNNDMFVMKLDASGTVLEYATYLGGSDDDFAQDIAVDPAGNAYLTGWTNSANFPTTSGSFDSTCSGFDEAFVTKLDASGGLLVYSGCIGTGKGVGLALDAAGSAYVTGFAGSGFPTTAGAFDATVAGFVDAFVTKLDAAGASLVYSTVFGGSSLQPETGFDIAVDAVGNAYVAGHTWSSDFPTTAGAYQTTGGMRSDAFVTKLNATGSALIWSTYLGGPSTFSDEFGYGIALDAADNVYVTGKTGGSFPTTSGAFDPFCDGNDAFVTKLDASGAALSYSTCLGGDFSDVSYGIAVDAAGNAYVTGFTNSLNFPTTPDAFDASGNGDFDIFVTKVNAGGASLGYSTYLGGRGAEEGRDIAIDGSNGVYITGFSRSSNYPTTPGAFDRVWDGGADVVVSKINLGSPGRDLLVTAVSDPPTGIAPGGKFMVMETVLNNGIVDAGESTTRYYLSTDAIKSAGDVRLTGSRLVAALPAGMSSTGSRQVTVPAATPLAIYLLLACADDTKKVLESNEANNCAPSENSLLVGLPDLITSEVSVQSAAAMPGQKFNVTDTVTNQGNVLAAASKTRYYLSLDDAWSASDVLLTGTRNVVALAPGATSMGNRRVTVPLTTPADTYHVLACADDVKKIGESDEGNNCAAAVATIIIGP